MQSIVVYCGSNYGSIPDYYRTAQAMGTAIAQRGSTLVYGGGKAGLMGTVADAVLAAGGEAVGVIPTFLREKEVAHLGLSRLIETPDMTSRKNKMIELGSAFIALPGGLGTYEELFEVLSQAQLGLHHKPVGVLNTNGFFNPLLAMLEQTAQAGFMPETNLNLLCCADTPDELLKKMAAYRFVETKKWSRPAWLDQEAV
ncbi:lysine decarboxylase [Neisseria arctica]|uniref:Cytokinin riboside 5'-monophosphate phosphoribohydrolase n=1 Tax=Neisseria arctica TaxID=1470200 RepID=A0A0J0YTM7_9NEIS|nr:TIGR00730 family Rossman fold protein [Neisseria arctica]KLT73466.1 lysine decarboxylase [Neisseria arctica]UOO86131.1 TIGR00730 family Rossman fold protein [Neisseria arctica]